MAQTTSQKPDGARPQINSFRDAETALLIAFDCDTAEGVIPKGFVDEAAGISYNGFGRRPARPHPQAL